VLLLKVQALQGLLFHRPFSEKMKRRMLSPRVASLGLCVTRAFGRQAVATLRWRRVRHLAAARGRVSLKPRWGTDSKVPPVPPEKIQEPAVLAQPSPGLLSRWGA